VSALDELAAKQAITEVLHSFCRGADRRDWDLLRSCFHEDAYDDHGIFQGNREELVEWLAAFLGSTFDATVHTVTNVLITVDGDRAGSESYVNAWHRFHPDGDAPRRVLIAAARYLDRFERRDGTWAISHRQLAMDWAKVETITESFDLGESATFGRTDRDDPSYAVLGLKSS
jgi:SnoaL-like domain